MCGKKFTANTNGVWKKKRTHEDSWNSEARNMQENSPWCINDSVKMRPNYEETYKESRRGGWTSAEMVVGSRIITIGVVLDWVKTMYLDDSFWF